MDYEKLYKEALERAKDYKNDVIHTELKVGENIMDYIFPELKENEDEKIRKALLNYMTKMWGNSQDDVCGVHVEDAIAWLNKQSKPNPYSGTSFKYNRHTWGMCARDNGVEILFDGELKAFLSSEKSFIYPIHPQPNIVPKSAMETAIKEENVGNSESKFKVGDWI